MTQTNTTGHEKNVLIPYWVKLTAVFFFGWIALYATRTIIGPLMGQMEISYELNGKQTGLIMSAFFLGYTIMNVPSGFLGDILGKKKVLVVGVIAFALFTMISGMMTTYVSFMFMWVLVGIFQGFYYGPQYGLSSEAIPKKHLTLGSAIINSGMAFGISLGYYISTISVETLKMDWHAPFYIIGGITLAIGIAMFFIIKDRPQALDASGVQAPKEKVSLKVLFGNRNINMCYVIIFCVMYGFFVLVTWLPKYLEEARGITGTNVATMASLVPWFAIPGSIFFSWVCDRIGKHRPVLLIMLPISLIAVLAVPLSSSNSVLVIALIVYGIVGKISTNPVLVAVVAESAPKSTLSSSFGVYNCLGMIGSILAPYMTGWIKDATGSYDLSFYVAGALIGVAIIASLMITQNKEAKA